MKAFLAERARQPAPRVVCAPPASQAIRAPQAPLVLWVRIAGSFLARARGLIARPPPAAASGLLLQGVCSVHGCGMRHPLDLVFLDRQGVIVRCVGLPPGRVRVCRRACSVLEMRAGEVARLGLVNGMRPQLVAVADIFGDPPAPSPVTRAGHGVFRVALLAAALTLLLLAFDTRSQPAGTGMLAAPASSVAPAVVAPVVPAVVAPLGPIRLARPMSARAIQGLEDEAEALYREAGGQAGGAAEAIRLYQSLAELAHRRTSHAWLRIGNIHQRAGAVGSAIDAYRQVLARFTQDAQDTQDTAASKALLNLAGLALEQARQSLGQLDTLPAVADAGLPDPYRQDLQSLAQRLERHAAGVGRNVVQEARGSLHVNPADRSPPRSVAGPASRAGSEPLPRVEYLLGDPRRADKPAGEMATGAKRGGKVGSKVGGGR